MYLEQEQQEYKLISKKGNTENLKKKNYRSKQIATKYKLDLEKSSNQRIQVSQKKINK